MEIKNCLKCGKKFEAKRGDARYCSDRCRKQAQRVPDVPDNAVPLNYVPDNQGKIVPDSLKEIPPVPEDVLNKSEEEREKGLEKLADNLIEAWRSQWVLENHTLEELGKNKVWIPNWRRKRKFNGSNCPLGKDKCNDCNSCVIS